MERKTIISSETHCTEAKNDVLDRCKAIGRKINILTETSSFLVRFRQNSDFALNDLVLSKTSFAVSLRCVSHSTLQIRHVLVKIVILHSIAWNMSKTSLSAWIESVSDKIMIFTQSLQMCRKRRFQPVRCVSAQSHQIRLNRRFQYGTIKIFDFALNRFTSV